MKQAKKPCRSVKSLTKKTFERRKKIPQSKLREICKLVEGKVTSVIKK